ncbi:unnamed protein product [Camellia sinensis]
MLMTGNNNEGEERRNRPACASCKHQRKRCHQGCLMAPHFPSSKTEEFEAVHAVFGVSNVTKIIKTIDFARQKQAVKSFIWEALWWKRDPAHGPLGHVKLEETRNFSNEQRNYQNTMQSLLPHPPPSSSLVPCLPWIGDYGINAMNFIHNNGQLASKSSAMTVNPSYVQQQIGGVNNPSFMQARERQSNGIDGLIQACDQVLLQGQEGRDSEAIAQGQDRVIQESAVMRSGHGTVGPTFGHRGELMRLVSQGREGSVQNNCSDVLPRGGRVRVRGDNLADHSQQYETKKAMDFENAVRRLWECRNMEYMSVDPEDSVGGLLCIWDPAVFQLSGGCCNRRVKDKKTRLGKSEECEIEICV